MKLNKKRKQKGLTLEDLSSITGLSVGKLSLLERNQCNPTLMTLRRVEKVLGPVEW